MSTNMSANYRVGIVGGTGYTGSELLRQLAHHPQVSVHAITSRSEAGQSVTQMFPHLRGYYDYLFFSAPDEGLLEQCDVVFFATPHGVAMQQTPELLKKGIKVIDLGADFRIQAVEVFEKWYQHAHQSPDILKTAVYGLPEVHRSALAQTSLVANPGCYPTTVLLGLLPLIENQSGLIDMQSIIADCKSGVSGAGKKADATLLYAELSENFKAYGVAGHRHHPEILEQIHAISGTTQARLIFTPHLVPMIRGMFSTIYVNLTQKGKGIDLQQCYEQRYANEPFVDVLPANVLPETRFVRGSNRLLISVRRVEEDRAIILVAQDNVVKGASGQAIQCMNILLGLPETAGLHAVGLLP